MIIQEKAITINTYHIYMFNSHMNNMHTHIPFVYSIGHFIVLFVFKFTIIMHLDIVCSEANQRY